MASIDDVVYNIVDVIQAWHEVMMDSACPRSRGGAAKASSSSTLHTRLLKLEQTVAEISGAPPHTPRATPERNDGDGDEVLKDMLSRRLEALTRARNQQSDNAIATVTTICDMAIHSVKHTHDAIRYYENLGTECTDNAIRAAQAKQRPASDQLKRDAELLLRAVTDQLDSFSSQLSAALGCIGSLSLWERSFVTLREAVQKDERNWQLVLDHLLTLTTLLQSVASEPEKACEALGLEKNTTAAVSVGAQRILAQIPALRAHITQLITMSEQLRTAEAQSTAAEIQARHRGYDQCNTFIANMVSEARALFNETVANTVAMARKFESELAVQFVRHMQQYQTSIWQHIREVHKRVACGLDDISAMHSVEEAQRNAQRAEDEIRTPHVDAMARVAGGVTTLANTTLHTSQVARRTARR